MDAESEGSGEGGRRLHKWEGRAAPRQEPPCPSPAQPSSLPPPFPRGPAPPPRTKHPWRRC